MRNICFQLVTPPAFLVAYQGEMRLKTFAAMIAVLSTCRAIDWWHIRTCGGTDNHMCVIIPRTLGSISVPIRLEHSRTETAITYILWADEIEVPRPSSSREHGDICQRSNQFTRFGLGFLFLLRLHYCYYYFVVDNPRHSRLLCRWLSALASAFVCLSNRVFYKQLLNK